jgi:hypothetical protein
LQEEIIHLDFPGKFTLPRRYACRYIKITIDGTPKPIKLFDFSFRASTSADTFWEAYIPDDLEFSPYKDRMINSQCHAWSCTPTYFIRKYEL